MSSYRWTRHRVFDSSGLETLGDAAISMWWIARAAAEETLQGSPMVAGWLKLFRAHLSETDLHYLRWRGDLAESAELRRAYSGLYGRYLARALLANHLGLTRFVSMKRNGITIPGAIDVWRSSKGDIPDWVAWDDQNSRFVLCEAKGSLSASDFLSGSPPRCIAAGKSQFGRVTCAAGGSVIYPDQWVAAARWVTDDRGSRPVTVLWDPPVEQAPFNQEDADQYRVAMTRAWLNSIADGLGWSGADELLSADRMREALIVRAKPGDIPEEMDWPRSASNDEIKFDDRPVSFAPRLRTLRNDLTESAIYKDQGILQPRGPEETAFEGAFLSAVVTRFGVQPIRTRAEYQSLQRYQENARELRSPAMLIGIPINIDPKQRRGGKCWLDGAGIAAQNDLAVFDLREIDVQLAEKADI